jgi:hypothetical protein
MSGLETAAGVIAVAGLLARVASLCKRYSREVINAKTDIARLEKQVEALQFTWDEVNRLLDSKYGERLKASQNLRRGVSTSLALIGPLEQKMRIKKGHKAMSRVGIRTLSWPFTRKEVDKIIQELKESQANMTLALQVDTAYVMWLYPLPLNLERLILSLQNVLTERQPGARLCKAAFCRRCCLRFVLQPA